MFQEKFTPQKDPYEVQPRESAGVGFQLLLTLLGLGLALGGAGFMAYYVISSGGRGTEPRKAITAQKKSDSSAGTGKSSQPPPRDKNPEKKVPEKIASGKPFPRLFRETVEGIGIKIERLVNDLLRDKKTKQSSRKEARAKQRTPEETGQENPWVKEENAASAAGPRGSIGEIYQVPLGKSGSSFFIGMYENTGPELLSKPQALIKLLDKEGRTVKSAKGYGSLDYLWPGEKTPVIAVIRKPPPYHRVIAEHEPKKPWTKPQKRIKLKFSGVRVVKGSGNYYYIRGRVANRDVSDARSVKIIATLSAKNGRLSGAGSGYVKNLSPGKTKDFKFSIFYSGPKPARYKIIYNAQPSL